MRISSGVGALLLIISAGGAWASDGARDRTAQAALEKGLVAYKTGAYATAIPALKEAAANGSDAAGFFAEFYMARIYADSAGALTDHSKAFVLFRKLADENADIAPEDDPRAPFVAKAFIALAGYVRSGLADIGVRPDARLAANYLHHAAIFFGDKDAQFELARLYLAEGGKDDVRRGLHYLSSLSERSYPPAQALLAELFWNGRYVKTDQRRALALITMAVENAAAPDRIWIEETYQSIFCASTEGTRQEADSIIERWRRTFARPVAEPVDRDALGGREVLPERQCSNGEAVAIRRAAPHAAIVATTPAAKPEVVQGSVTSLGFRAAGGPSPTGATK